MPSLYTHYSFGKDVLNKLNKNIQKEININIDYYNMFNQGFDNLYYYLFKWNYYRYFGIRCHKKNIDLFFKHAITYVKKNKLSNNSTCTNLIYGVINHYILDTIIHPFINYQVTNLNFPHTKLEFMIDGYLYKKNNNLKWQNKIYKTLIPKLKFSNDLLNLLDYTFFNTYNEKNIGHIFNISHNLGYYIYRYFINDYYGIKAYFYKLIDFINPKKEEKFSKLTFRINESNEKVLNPLKLEWHHPNNLNKKYNYSFEELYDFSLHLAVKLNTLAYNIIHKDEDINKLLEEISLITIDNI